MMWFWLSLICLLCWSGSDLFSKIGCDGEDDKLSHLKMVIAVGVVMGLHALYEIVFTGLAITPYVFWTYLPVSLLYIVSMALGYLGLRYIELAISSPICNSSGALVVVLCILFGMSDELVGMQFFAMALTCVGVIGLGFVEAYEDPELRFRRQSKSNRHYAKNWIALALPIAYSILDALGTFADSVVLDRLDEAGVERFEDAANASYELTFLLAGIVCFIYVVLIRKDRLIPRREAPKYAGAIFETAGQFAYIYALADTEHVALSVSIISAYCVVSALWSCLFLKERLSWKHILMIAVTVVGIVILGMYDA